MSKSNNSSGSAAGGVGFCGLLLTAFIVLKLLGVINWSWIWVLSPIWIPIISVIVITTIFLVFITK